MFWFYGGLTCNPLELVFFNSIDYSKIELVTLGRGFEIWRIINISSNAPAIFRMFKKKLIDAAMDKSMFKKPLHFTGESFLKFFF